MAENESQNQIRYRNQFMDPPDKRDYNDRRSVSCFIENDRRCGIACRRKEKQRKMERRIAIGKVRFYPEYYRFV
jgi:hypothetical protein